jgi:hypothetical protein
VHVVQDEGQITRRSRITQCTCAVVIKKYFIIVISNGKRLTITTSTCPKQAIVAYASDFSLLVTVVRALGLSELTQTRAKMITSIDHTIWFHDHNFRADEWYVYNNTEQQHS